MKLEQNDKQFLFSNTEIPDVFFTEYLSSAKGDYVKLYLYFLFLSKHEKDIGINDLSKFLSIPYPTIKEGLDFWENLGVITKTVNGYKLNDLQELELHKIYSPKLTSSPENIEKNLQNQYRAKAIESIKNSYFQGIMSRSWYTDIDLWFKKYGFDEQVMIALFDYCFNKSALHRNYVVAVADNWSKNNIKTFTDLELYEQKRENIYKIKDQICKKLGIVRKLTQYEESYIEKWILDFDYSFSIIEIALKRTTSKTNPSFDYLDKIISDWHDRNLKTSSEIENYLNDMKKKNKDVKTLEKKTGYQSYEQRKYNNLDELYANNQTVV